MAACPDGQAKSAKRAAQGGTEVFWDIQDGSGRFPAAGSVFNG